LNVFVREIVARIIGAAMTIRAWIHRARDLGASDLHIEAGTPPVVRVRGELLPIAEPVPAAGVEQDARALLGAEAWEHLLARGSADVSLALGGTRCRINVYRTLRGLALAVRLLTPSVNGLRDCNLHPALRRFTAATAGLVIVSGPTGSGKSTTLAALIEEINAADARNIISLESPIEYVFTNRRSLIRQREIPTHSPSFEQAIVDALRENPDVLVIGEMRTPEVMRLTLNAAETGHLVLATMHSSSCAEALTRIGMSFPAEIQGSIRAQLADCLVGVVCQRLDYLPEYRLRVPRCEVLWGTLAAKATVRSGQMSQIANVIQSGGEDGMWNFDRYQRWMEQKKDWVRSDSLVGGDVLAPAAPMTPAPTTTAAPAVSSAARGTISIEEVMDIEELADLAKQIEKRERP
jgi:twitching motility protein PilT